MSEVNVPLLRKAVEWVEAQEALPEIDREWRQRNWITHPEYRAQLLIDCQADNMSVGEYEDTVVQVAQHCGTAYCVAGYVAQLVDEGYKDSLYGKGMNDVHCSEKAAEALGIPYHMDGTVAVTPLFEGTNDAATVRKLAEWYAGEEL